MTDHHAAVNTLRTRARESAGALVDIEREQDEEPTNTLLNDLFITTAVELRVYLQAAEGLAALPRADQEDS
ncbi:MAG: hypothetical protein LC624_00960 [Halobacteriales archaeon]|nr:hypothetical protein [Halobacteriales archaeon]